MTVYGLVAEISPAKRRGTVTKAKRRPYSRNVKTSVFRVRVRILI